MRRALLLLLAVIATTWLEYQFFPGHTYLEADTQLYVPMLERLDSPGFLSRDLVATHPNVSYTIYDELTLFLHEAGHVDFQAALVGQQLVYRAAAIFGIFLLALSTGLPDLLAFAVAFLVNLGAALPGPAISVVEAEPVPHAFAFGLILLAAGLMTREKPLLAGLAAGFALVYDAPIAAAFWAIAIVAVLFDARLRHLFRPPLTIFIVFMLLLANLAQLQPGVVESQNFLGHISEAFAALQKDRTRFVWVSLWARQELWHYAAMLVIGLWATARTWRTLNRQARWFFLALPLFGILSVPLSDLLLDHLRWSFIPQIQPARTLLYTAVFTVTACAIAGSQALTSRRFREACFWFFVVCALPLNARLLDLLKLTHWTVVAQFALASLLASALVVLFRILQNSRLKPLILLVPVAAIFAMPRVEFVKAPKFDRPAVNELANWAERNTWGSSMFLFPDAGRALYPGVFRAESRRALWADWNSGCLVPYFESFAADWLSRWQDTMQDRFSPQRLQRMLSLPIDYYALRGANRLRDIKPVFQNRDFVVYDANDLRNANSLRLAARAN